MRNSSHHTRGALWAVGSATAYSLSSVVGKHLLDALEPPSLLFWRFSVASAVLWLVLTVWRRRGGPDPASGVPRRVALGLGAMFGLMVLLGFVAIQRLDVSVYIVIVYTYPAFVVAGSWFVGVRAGAWTWVALAVVLTGVGLTASDIGGGSIDVVGVALTLVQAVVFASYMILSSRIMPPHLDGLVSAAWITLGAAMLMAPLALVAGFQAPPARLTGEVLVFALVPTLLSSVAFFRALRYLTPGVVAMIMTLEVALAIVWSVLFLDETVVAQQWVGAAVVVAGVLVAQWASLRDAKAIAPAL